MKLLVVPHLGHEPEIVDLHADVVNRVDARGERGSGIALRGGNAFDGGILRHKFIESAEHCI